jgi:hypothetical protein
MRDFLRTMLLTASIVFLMSRLAPNHDSGVGIEYVVFARAMDLDPDLDRSGDSDGRTREGTKDGKQTNEGQRGIGSKGKNGFFENASTLEDVWSDLKLLVPNRGTDGYIQPEAIVVADFERIVLDMMTVDQRYNFRGDNERDHEKHHDNDNSRLHTPSTPPCDHIDLRSLKGMYRIGTFVDTENGRSYCILATTSILYPWGNVVVDLDASSATKNISFDCPHPKFDVETGEQGIRMLKGTTARSWIVSGSHRMANNRSTLGTCQPQYSHYSSDVAHSVDTCFLAAVAATKFYYESVVQQDYTSVQLHGMGKTTCGTIDTFFSHGSCSQQTVTNTEKIDVLQRIARAHPFDNGRHAVAGRDDGSSSSSDCKLCGSTNIQGRLINGVARNDLCDTFASSHNGRFIQIEQKREYRRESFARFWNDVFNEAYPRFSALATVSTNTQQAHSSSANEDVGIDKNDFYDMCIGIRNNLQTIMTDQRN